LSFHLAITHVVVSLLLFGFLPSLLFLCSCIGTHKHTHTDTHTQTHTHTHTYTNTHTLGKGHRHRHVSCHEHPNQMAFKLIISLS
jgi:hypothetical protein